MINTSVTEIGYYQCKFCLLITESAKLVGNIWDQEIDNYNSSYYFLQNLTEIVEGYFKYMEQSLEVPKPEGLVSMPADLKNRNKYRIVFGNIRDIYDYHKK